MTDLFHRFQPEEAQARKKELRPHQSNAIAMLRSSLARGNRRVVVQGPTGVGKTLIAAKIIEGALDKGNRVIFTAPAVSLIDQTVSAFEAEGISGIGVMQASHPRTNPLARVQVASVQTLARRDIPPAALVIVDECFVAGTAVGLPDGSEAPIEQIAVGDLVMTAIGVGRVKATSTRSVAEIYRVEFEDGSYLECTGNHPFFTVNGWVEARALGEGACVVCREDMPRLRDGIQADLEGERSGSSRAGMARAEDLLALLLEEAEQSGEAAGCRREGVGDAAQDRTQARSAGWKWQRPDDAAGGSPDGSWRWLETGIGGECLAGRKEAWHPESLQNRHSASRDDDSDRGGWREPLPLGTTRAGSPEGRISFGARVVGVARIEREGPVTVYNLHVSGHPSYFAGGRLVHNCHIRAEVIEKLMAERPDVFFVGLSATPWAMGMGRWWQDLVVPVTIRDLIDAGYLSQFRVFAPDVPDMSGVKTVAGDYHEGQTAEIMKGATITASVVETWLERGENRPTLLFCVNRAHARQLFEAFERAGVAAAYCDAYTDVVERQLIERRFRAGEVKVACSVRTLTTGIDWPVSCIIDAAPTKSEMLHVQKIGRGLRINPGTEDLVVLDHAGNSLRLGLVTDIGHDALDDTERGPQKARAKAERLPKECVSCGVLHTGLTCPSCGHVRKPVAGVETVDGELIEITGKPKGLTREEKQAWWSGLLTIAAKRGRTRGWAAHTYREKTGVWPKGLADWPGEPSPEVWNFVKFKDIRWAKRQERGAA